MKKVDQFSTSDGNTSPVFGRNPGPIPSFPTPSVGRLQSSSMPAIGSGSAPLPAGSASQGASAAAPPACTAYADEIRERAWRLLDGRQWTLEAWFTEANELLADLKAETAPSKKADPAAHQGDAWRALQPTLEHMLAHGDASHTRAWVEEVCLSWWDVMTGAQDAQNISPARSYRAMAAYVLARHKHAQGDLGGALRWAALAHISDVLAGHPGSGGAEVVLQFGLGVPRAAIDELSKLAASTAQNRQTWNETEAFPELILTSAVAAEWGRHLVAPTLVPSHHVCRPFLNIAVKWALDVTGLNTDDQGKRLEKVAAYLAGTLPGARPVLGINAPGGACEYDIVATQVGSNIYRLPAESTSLLIECKNCNTTVKSANVGYFLARLKYAGLDFGVLMAKEAISGWSSDEPLNAKRLLEGFCQREHLACVVVTGDDLRALCTDGTFAALLEDRHRLMTLGKAKKPSA